MRRARCARPACPGQPEAWFGYDYEARCAWLDDDPEPDAGVFQQWPLCARHADNLRVPRGWFCVDRRSRHGEGAGKDEAGVTAAAGGSPGAAAGHEAVPVAQAARTSKRQSQGGTTRTGSRGGTGGSARAGTRGSKAAPSQVEGDLSAIL